MSGWQRDDIDRLYAAFVDSPNWTTLKEDGDDHGDWFAWTGASQAGRADTVYVPCDVAGPDVAARADAALGSFEAWEGARPDLHPGAAG
jgi:hypothetical protein